MIRIRWSRAADAGERTALEGLHRDLRAISLVRHAALRSEIARGAARGDALRRRFDDAPMFERDHFVEEVLGIAYPPLDEPVLAPELLAYAPSGYDEIVHALDATRLASGDRFLDLGSGTGKAVLLANLLTGATSSGVECNGSLHDLAVTAARDLGLEGARFRHSDVRDVVIDDAEVVFMYLPFTGTVLSAVMTQVIAMGQRRAPGERRFVCAGAFDTRRYHELVVAGPARSWLHVYACR